MKIANNSSESHIQTSYVNQPDGAVEDEGGILRHLWSSVAATILLTVICCGFYPLVVWAIAQAVFPNQANGSLLKKDGTPTTDETLAVGSALLGQNFSLPGYFHPRPSAAGGGYDPTSSGGSNLGPLSDKLINGLTSTPASAPSTAPTPLTAATTTTVITAPTTAPGETLAYDGIRLRTIHYASDTGLSFKLWNVKSDGSRTEVPFKNYQDAQGNWNDIALVDAFPHPPTDTPDRVVLIADNFTDGSGLSVSIPADAVTASASGLDPHISPDNAMMQSGRVAGARNIKSDQVQTLIAKYTDRPGFGIFGDPGVNVLRLNLALDAQYPLPTSTAPTTMMNK